MGWRAPRTQQALFLIEAKTNLVGKHIEDMPQRIESTVQFMTMCMNNELPGAGANCYYLGCTVSP